MIEASYLKNQFLIAMPSMDDPHFSHTVTYLCQHTDDGALGIVINRPTGMKLGEIFQQIGIKTDLEEVSNTPVFAGGPVQQERGFVIHSPCEQHWDSSITTADNITLTSSKACLSLVLLTGRYVWLLYWRRRSWLFFTKVVYGFGYIKTFLTNSRSTTSNSAYT